MAKDHSARPFVPVRIAVPIVTGSRTENTDTSGQAPVERLTATASVHRRDACADCEYMIDGLRTTAPFWKRQRRRPARAGFSRLWTGRSNTAAGTHRAPAATPGDPS
jgi:hypothetical protein